MDTIHTVVIGAGHAGLATSRALTDAGIEHVVLERGRVGERWLSERWDSLHLLTPNWMSRLPGWRYTGAHPDGFMTAPELAAHLTRYARSFAAPVAHEAVRSVTTSPDLGFRVSTDRGRWRARHVVVATGHCHRAAVPPTAAHLARDVAQVDPLCYRGPQTVEPGGVLVVGASSTGVQIAAELNAAGRDVVLAAGRHTRMPRRYRGRDIMVWLDALGTFDRTVDDLAAGTARIEPSLQLVAGTDDLDLAVLQDTGVQLTGRFLGADGPIAYFADDLADETAAADARMRRVLANIDALAPGDRSHAPGPGEAAAHPTRLAGRDRHEDATTGIQVARTPTRIDLRRRRIRTVVWATGFRGEWPWLHLPVCSQGRITQYRGQTVVPGLYTVGQRFQHRRGSGLVDGVRHDVADVLTHITSDIAAARPNSAPALTGAH